MTSKSEIATIDAVQRAAAQPVPGMSVVAIEDVDLLEDYVPAWEDLASDAIEVNPFYEPWMLIPALRGLADGKDLRVVLVLTISEGAPVLCGVFPLERKTRHKGLPITIFSLWKHIYCPLCTPLIRNGCARECLDAFLDWLASECGGPLMEFSLVSGEGPFHKLLDDALTKRKCSSFVSESYTRALFQPMETSDTYERAAISTRHRQDMRRKLRRLSETGRVEFDALEPAGDVDRWIDEFLRLEVSSWKGKEGSAFACAEANQTYFVTIAKEAFRKGKLMMSAIRLDSQPLALRLSIISGRGAFAFKIAYDETHARFSPGILLEIQNIRSLHCRPDIEWMDSCAAQVHFINRLWLDRRTIQSVLVSTGGRPAELIVRLTPHIRRLNRIVRGLPRSVFTQKENQQ
jgi:CelD/BcsL family acetyltransferase involved in cellulose biosynthesis